MKNNMQIYIEDGSKNIRKITMPELQIYGGHTSRNIHRIIWRCITTFDIKLLSMLIVREICMIAHIKAPDYQVIQKRYFGKTLDDIHKIIILVNRKKYHFHIEPYMKNKLEAIYMIMVRDQYNLANHVNNKIVIDAGANIGITSVFAAINGAIKVYAFEPLKENFSILSKNIILNNLTDKIIPIHKGVGDRRKNAIIYYRNPGDEGASLHYRPSSKKQKVKITTIDQEFAQNKESIGFIKIDTEGYEKQVILGAKNIIKKSKPILSLSAYHYPRDKKNLANLIKSLDPDYDIKLLTISEEVLYCQ